MGRLPPSHIDDPKTVGERIRLARETHGLSLRDVAFAGCSASYLSRVEAGTRVPGRPVIEELARRLDTTADELAGIPQDGRIPAWRVSNMELEVRLRNETAASAAEDLHRDAELLGDPEAAGRALEALGHLAMAERRDEQAIAQFERARAADPSITVRARPALFQALGRAYAGAGDIGRSISILESAVDDAASDPIDIPLLVRLGTYLANAYTDGGRFSDAERVLAQLLRHEKDMTDTVSLVRMEFALARTYAEEGRNSIAERYSRSLLARLEHSEEQETLGRAHLLLAEILLDRKASTEAEPHLEAAAKLMGPTVAPPEMALITVELGRAALQQNNPDRAEQLARQALAETEATEPGIAGSAYALLAHVAFDRGDLGDARTLCNNAIEQIDHRSAPHHVAAAYRLLSKVEEADGDLEAALGAARQAAILSVNAPGAI
jgi:transcriptional regulator with XRE-family HTH domain